MRYSEVLQKIERRDQLRDEDPFEATKRNLYLVPTGKFPEKLPDSTHPKEPFLGGTQTEDHKEDI